MHQLMLPTPLDHLHARSRKTAQRMTRDATPKSGMQDRDALDSGAIDRSTQQASRAFHFRKFGHEIIATGWCR
jgi:hypothetical protein